MCDAKDTELNGVIGLKTGKACLKCAYVSHGRTDTTCHRCGRELVGYAADGRLDEMTILRGLRKRLFGKRAGISMLNAVDLAYSDSRWKVPSGDTAAQARQERLRTLRDRINGMVTARPLVQDCYLVKSDQQPDYVEIVACDTEALQQLGATLANWGVSPWDYRVIVLSKSNINQLEREAKTAAAATDSIAAFRKYCKEYDQDVSRNAKQAGASAVRATMLATLLRDQFKHTSHIGDITVYRRSDNGWSQVKVNVYNNAAVTAINDFRHCHGIDDRDIQIHIGTEAEWQAIVESRRIQALVVAKCFAGAAPTKDNPAPDDRPMVDRLKDAISRLNRKFKTHGKFVGTEVARHVIDSQEFHFATVKVATAKMAQRVKRHMVNYRIPDARFAIIVINIATNLTERYKE